MQPDFLLLYCDDFLWLEKVLLEAAELQLQECHRAGGRSKKSWSPETNWTVNSSPAEVLRELGQGHKLLLLLLYRADLFTEKKQQQQQ